MDKLRGRREGRMKRVEGREVSNAFGICKKR